MANTRCHRSFADGAYGHHRHKATLIVLASQYVDGCADAILLYESIGLSSYSASTEGGFCVVFSEHQLMHEIKMNGKIQATTEEKSQGNW